MRGTRPSAPQGSAHAISLYLWSNLLGPRRGRGPGHAPLHHRSPGPSLRRNLRNHRARRPRRAPARSGRLAHHQEAASLRQHHPAASPGAHPNSSRSKTSDSSCGTTGSAPASFDPMPTSSTPLRRLEQNHRPARVHHVHRTAQMGSYVLTNRSWYMGSPQPGPPSAGRSCNHRGRSTRPYRAGASPGVLDETVMQGMAAATDPDPHAIRQHLTSRASTLMAVACEAAKNLPRSFNLRK